MYIDFALIDTETNEAEARDVIKKVIDHNSVNSITVPFYFAKLIKPFINNGLDFSCLIDYPLGISDPKTRICAVKEAIDVNFNTIDVSMPQNLAANRKYDKIREDIKQIRDVCLGSKINIRYILEYRKFDHFCLKKICEIFENMEIKYVFPSSGYFLDNLSDNIIASVFLHKNSKDLNIISSGNIWLDKHFENLINSGIFGFRTSSFTTLQNFTKFNFQKHKNNGVY
jgi:deoxyribose-phosphate aldolase